jgi:hypothetical protein
MSEPRGVRAVASGFRFPGEISGIAPHGNGHINQTYCVTCHAAGASARYILQRINRNVFHDPAAVMQNIARVTTHLAAQLAGRPDGDRRALTLVPARDGNNSFVDADGETWRAYRFIEDTKTCESLASPDQAFQVARAFGRFQRQLAQLPEPPLHETIPDFHHTPRRFAALETAVQTDVCNRALLAKSEINFALTRRPIAATLLDADLPQRITHNDTKLNNVLFDAATGEGLCVIDLDTVMPGLALYDFGDMVRTTTSPASEDEQDLSKVSLQFPNFEALVRGYLEETAEFLTAAERQLLVATGKIITLEQGIRFLADHLAGDVYYRIHREGHNLDRCRTQFKLVESIERQEEKMRRLVRSIAE